MTSEPQEVPGDALSPEPEYRPKPILRIAGVDYGSVRIGIAIADDEVKLAGPLEIYTRSNQMSEAKFFTNLAQMYRLGLFVVGLPIHGDGSESQKSTEARRFGAWLQKTTKVDVVFFDERYTTVEADNLMGGGIYTKKQKKERRDMIAATVLLQSFLEAGMPRDARPEALG